MIKVEYIDHSGSDLSVVNAARVSFAKEVGEMSVRDEKLILFLAKHKHKSPFNHCFVSFRVTAPVFVARQLVKHEYLPWNETSRRYVDSVPDFFRPSSWRKRAEDKKQGSAGDIENQAPCNLALTVTHKVAEWTYRFLLWRGVAPEQARMVLPQSMMTEWIWSGTLGAFAKMAALRLPNDSQVEAREVAEGVSTHMSELFPHSWAALLKHPIL